MLKNTYIYAASAISAQDTFGKYARIADFEPFEKAEAPPKPEYKKYVPPMMIRRMGKITRSSVATAFHCLQEAGIDRPGAIVAATGLGALSDTEKFLNVSVTITGNMLPPTSFIQSGHNTMAGQIALLLKSDVYNMTHVQQGISFEHALIDTVLLLNEGTDNILVGAVDEYIATLGTLAEKFAIDTKVAAQLSEGAAFFLAGSNKARALARLQAVEVIGGNTSEAVAAFLDRNGFKQDDISLCLVGGHLLPDIPDLPFENTIDYTAFSGRHFSTSGFGMYLAVSELYSARAGQNILIVNVNSPDETGLILLSNA